MKNRLISEIHNLLDGRQRVLIAIDGRCASGKSTLAAELKRELDCNVISADSFFLRPEQRTRERLLEAGGNIDYERLEAEVLIPLCGGQAFSYRAYDCHSQSFKEPVTVHPNRINIIEGSYCCNPRLIKYYDYKVFMSVDKAEQLRRIEERNGSGAVAVFRDKWITLEEKYFEECKIKELCDLVIE